MTQVLKKERQTLEDAASQLLSFALKAGAQSAEVCASFGQRSKITLEKQDYHMASFDDGYQLGLRVLSDQRQGFTSCNTTDPKELKEIALRAVEIANFSPSNPNYAIAASDNIPKDAPSDLWDESLHQLSLQTQKDWTKLMVDEATRDPRFRLNEGGVTIGSGLYLVMNSLGTHKLEKDTTASWSLMGMGIDGDVITSFDYFQEFSRKADSVPERILMTSRNFRDRVVRDLNQGPAKSYQGVVIFSPRAVLDILLSPLAYHFNGRSVVEKTGKWNLQDIGKEVVDPRLTIRDMPWLTDRMGFSVFDREGTPTRNQTVVENGKLSMFLMDHYAAKALHAKSTGHAGGGPGSVPSVGSHCFCIDGGKEPVADLYRRVADQQKEFLVLHRYSGQTDPITGDFSGVAKGGEWWNGSERAYCAKETLISGNLFDIFGKSLFGISKEAEVVESSEQSPTLAVNGISVTAG